MLFQALKNRMATACCQHLQHQQHLVQFILEIYNATSNRVIRQMTVQQNRTHRPGKKLISAYGGIPLKKDCRTMQKASSS